MKTSHYQNNTFHINYVIYEKNDSEILLDGVVTKNHKQFHTAIPIDPIHFSFLCEKAIGYEKTDSLWSKLFKTHDPVTELAPINHLGTELNFSSSDPIFNIN